MTIHRHDNNIYLFKQEDGTYNVVMRYSQQTHPEIEKRLVVIGRAWFRESANGGYFSINLRTPNVDENYQLIKDSDFENALHT